MGPPGTVLGAGKIFVIVNSYGKYFWCPNKNFQGTASRAQVITDPREEHDLSAESAMGGKDIWMPPCLLCMENR